MQFPVVQKKIILLPVIFLLEFIFVYGTYILHKLSIGDYKVIFIFYPVRINSRWYLKTIFLYIYESAINDQHSNCN